MNSETKEEFIKCSCGSHILQLTSDVEVHGENNSHFHQEFYLSMYTFGYGNGKPSLWWRIKTAWDVLTKGTMHSDSIIMTPEEANKVVNFIQRNSVV